LRSLTLKLVVVFWLVSLVGITVGVLFAGRVSFREIGDLADSQRLEVLVARLETYYQTNGGWQGVNLSTLPGSSMIPGAPNWNIVLADQQGTIVASTDRHLQDSILPPEELSHGQEIIVNNEVVGILVSAPRIPDMRPPPTEAILQRVSQSLIVGGIAASAVSLLLGLILARSFLKPIHALNSATQSVAQGDLEKTVPVNSNDEIGTLARSFNEMIDRLKHSRDQRRQMTADIAHELRTPLSLILGHSEALSDGVLPPTPETLTIIHDEAQQLARLVEDLRTLSLSETGELSLNIQRLDIGNLLRSMVDAYRSQIQQKQINLEVDISPNLPEIDGDPDRLGQIFRNLMANAIRFTESGGTVSIQSQQTADGIIVQVADNGPGIPVEELPNIFDRFYRGDKARNRGDGGSGLGLAIAKSLVELHHGQIEVESIPGEGSTFNVHLPLTLDP